MDEISGTAGDIKRKLIRMIASVHFIVWLNPFPQVGLAQYAKLG